MIRLDVRVLQRKRDVNLLFETILNLVMFIPSTTWKFLLSLSAFDVRVWILNEV